MLPSPELTDKLHKAQPLDLPSWWLSPEHDLVVLQNVGRFGNIFFLSFFFVDM